MNDSSFTCKECDMKISSSLMTYKPPQLPNMTHPVSGATKRDLL
jgi:hypothetical protein